ncbi:MAG: hypothetical protein HQL32_14625 [Planctomycetes bacterium]|nr:hypothetical protein [Planctomycetota bacterium]
MLENDDYDELFASSFAKLEGVQAFLKESYIHTRGNNRIKYNSRVELVVTEGEAEFASGSACLVDINNKGFLLKQIELDTNCLPLRKPRIKISLMHNNVSHSIMARPIRFDEYQDDLLIAAVYLDRSENIKSFLAVIEDV